MDEAERVAPVGHASEAGAGVDPIRIAVRRSHQRLAALAQRDAVDAELVRARGVAAYLHPRVPGAAWRLGHQLPRAREVRHARRRRDERSRAQRCLRGVTPFDGEPDVAVAHHTLEQRIQHVRLAGAGGEPERAELGTHARPEVSHLEGVGAVAGRRHPAPVGPRASVGLPVVRRR
ncbi:unannotated protein [freshwater metagenome]|uniref:Unannotated protein n=1 Tax=freshwater metagenome TaxID=449393 RepID=A0A6J7I9X0_9ZZZZ